MRKKEVPRYLRASIGSCHELCKYGKKEEKPWPHAMDLKLGSSETKKVMVGKRRHVSFDASEIIKREVVKQEQVMDSLHKKTTNVKLRSSSIYESRISRNVGTQKSKESKSSHEGKEIGVKIKKVESSKVGMTMKKVSVTPKGLVSPKPLVRVGENSRLSLNDTTSRSNHKPKEVQHIEYPAEEKILHVVELEIEKHDQIQSFLAEPCHHPPPPSPTQEEYDEYTVSEEAEYDEYSSVSKESESAEEEEEEEETKNLGESPDATQKLHFKRGKILNLKTEDDCPLKNLKFRRGRALEKSKTIRVQGKVSSKQMNDDDVTDEYENINGGKAVSSHQDVQDKKDTKRLFNNVTEKTASELVKARKVKDLIRAFETIISLQKLKPSVNSCNLIPEKSHEYDKAWGYSQIS